MELGILLVQFIVDKIPYWAASWKDHSNKNRFKYFNMNKYGNEEAFKLACEYQKSMVESLKR